MTHGTEAHAPDQRVGTPRLAIAEQPVVVHANVADEDRVVRQSAVDLERGALRINWLTVVSKTGRNQFVPFLTVAVDRH